MKQIMQNKLSLLFLSAVLLVSTANADKGKGGGGPLVTPPVDEATIRQTIPTLNMAVQMAFNRRQRFIKKFRPDEIESANLIKIFGNGDKLPQDLARVRFVPIEGPCFDSKQNPVRASIYNMPENQICMSVPLIAADLNAENYFEKLIALGVHEEAHRMGVMNDDEVEILQAEVEAKLQPNVKEYLSVITAELRAIDGLNAGLASLKSAIGRKGMGEVCGAIASNTLSILALTKAHDEAELSGVALLNTTDEARYLAAITKFYLLPTYCSRDALQGQRGEAFFGQRGFIVWKNTYDQSRYFVDVPSDIVVRRIDLGDKETFKLEIDDISMQLGILKKNLSNLAALKN